MTTTASPFPASSFGVRRPRLFRFGLTLLVGVLVADAVALREFAPAAGPASATPTAAVAVTLRAETGPGGHATIGVMETAASGSTLTFALLGKWQYHPSGSVPCPPEIAAHDGTTASLVGFMYPLAQGDRIKVFCLLRNTQTCCFGPRPQFNQYLFVETKEPVAFERRRPIQVRGHFKVDPEPTQGYIYRFEDAEVAQVGGFDEPVDAKIYAEANHLPLWDWSLLADLPINDRAKAALPAAVTALTGKTVVVDGYIHQRDPGPPPQVRVGAHPPPGRPDGHVPTLVDAMGINPAAGTPLPPDWQDRGVWQGVLHVSSDPQQWDDTGIVHLEGATVCARPPETPGSRIDHLAILIGGIQAILLLSFLATTLGRRAPPPPAAA
jgi:hypothetical protein